MHAISRDDDRVAQQCLDLPQSLIVTESGVGSIETTSAMACSSGICAPGRLWPDHGRFWTGQACYPQTLVRNSDWGATGGTSKGAKQRRVVNRRASLCDKCLDLNSNYCFY